MKRGISTYLLIISISAAFRLLIFYPHIFPNADAGEYATFVREIAESHGLIPSDNTIYYPGSLYIYPPLLFYMALAVWLPMAHVVFDPRYALLLILLVIAILAGSVMNALIYKNTAHYKSSYFNIICAIVPVFFSIDIYSLTWGGFPFILDLLFFVAIIFYLDKDSWNTYDAVTVILLSVAVPLTHDLSWFLFEISMVMTLVFNILKKRRNKIIHTLLILSISSAVGLYWWIPRLKFVLSAFFVSQVTGNGIFTSTSGQTTDLILVALYLIPVVFISLLEMVGSIRNRRMEKIDTATLAMVSTSVGLIFIVKDVVITARIVLYTYTFLMIIVLKNLNLVHDTFRNLKKVKLIRTLKYTALAMLIAAIPGQVYTGIYSSHFYSSGEYQYDSGLIQWASTNMRNGTIAAPLIGNYISGEDGLPVILYSGFIVGENQIYQRNAVIDLILNPNAPSTISEVEFYNIRYLVVQNIYINTTVDSHLLSFTSSPFHIIKRFSYYTVYSIYY